MTPTTRRDANALLLRRVTPFVAPAGVVRREDGRNEGREERAPFACMRLSPEALPPTLKRFSPPPSCGPLTDQMAPRQPTEQPAHGEAPDAFKTPKRPIVKSIPGPPKKPKHPNRSQMGTGRVLNLEW